MFKRIAFIYVLVLVALNVRAQVPIDAILSGVEVLKGAQDQAGDVLDILDSSQDLLEEIGTESDDLDSFSQNMILYNRELTELRSDLRAVGATEDYVSDVTDKFNSSNSSLSQKMRSLRRALSSIKQMHRMIFNKASGKEASTAIQKGILATEQQALHLQIQNMQWMTFQNLKEERKEIAQQKMRQDEINNTILALAEPKRNNQYQKPLSVIGINQDFMQGLVCKASIGLLIFAFVLMMFTPMQSEAKNALKASLFGIFLSAVLPLLVTLYRQWLGI